MGLITAAKGWSESTPRLLGITFDHPSSFELSDLIVHSSFYLIYPLSF